MKFYRDRNFYYWVKIVDHELTAIHCEKGVRFVKNGNFHNNKNAAFIYYSGVKYFYLNEKGYGDHNNFTKKSWRKFVKLITFI
jgi:hypothetical protein